jgi:oxygen-dependent protoporphyrinogen oxidase
VIVVGAGLAGLAAAHRLRTAQFSVTVLEARARIGGKHARDTLGGVAYEAWPALLPRGARAFAELVAELGVAPHLARESLAAAGRLRNAHVRIGSLRLRDALGASPLAPFRLRRLALLESWLGGRIDPEAPERETRLDDRGVADFARVYLGRRARDRLLEPLLATLFGVAAEPTSRELLFALLDGRAAIALERVAGIPALVDALAASAGEIRAGARVASLESEGGVRLESGERLEAEALVLAVGAAEAARLLPERSPAESAASERLRASPTLVLAVATRADLRLPAPVVFVPAREGGELAGMIDATPDGASARILRLVARPGLFARHGHRPDPELAHFLVESATRVVPGLSGRIDAQRLHRLPDVPAFEVGHYRALATLRATRGANSERPIFLAGDWTVAPHLEGELASGLRAAAELRATISPPTSPP